MYRDTKHETEKLLEFKKTYKKAFDALVELRKEANQSYRDRREWEPDKCHACEDAISEAMGLVIRARRDLVHSASKEAREAYYAGDDE